MSEPLYKDTWVSSCLVSTDNKPKHKTNRSSVAHALQSRDPAAKVTNKFPILHETGHVLLRLVRLNGRNILLSTSEVHNA
jgi:hypothetical protein